VHGLSPSLEAAIRLGCLFGVLAAMVAWEQLAPRRPWSLPKPMRWTSNLGLMALNTVVARLAIPLSAVGLAAIGTERGWGLLNLVAWPDWLEFLLGVSLLDFAIYIQHVLFHAVPAFWRLHRVHHADLDFDVTTGGRFHTLEILLSAGIKLAVILALGPSAWAVLTFEVLLNATSMFNHSNVRMPGWLDRVLRWVVVTPDMHRVHHSVIRNETNSNYGFNLPWWDRLLGTYRPQPQEGHEQMTIGLEEPREERVCDRLLGMLWLPFRQES